MASNPVIDRQLPLWQDSVVPTHVAHVLISDVDTDSLALTNLAARIAIPNLSQVTVCCRSGQTNGKEAKDSDPASVRVLRDKGLTVWVERSTSSELDNILAIDRQQSIDLILVREHGSAEPATGHSVRSVQMARQFQRPVIACGPLCMHNNDRACQGPVLAAVPMHDSKKQIVHASGAIGALLHVPLTILHAADIEHEFSRPDNLAGVACECQLLVDWMTERGMSTVAEVACGPVVDVVTRFAEKMNASLIVLGVDLEERDREAVTSDNLRKHILMAAPCPILFVPTFRQ